MSIYFAPISWGLGDLVVSLPILQQVIAQTQESVVLVERSNLQSGLTKRIAGIGGSIPEELLDTGHLKSANHRYINLRDHPIQTDYWWGSPEFEKAYPQFKINDILNVIVSNVDFKVDLTVLKPLQSKFAEESENAIIFFPGTDGPYKCWPTEMWISLKNDLEKEGHVVRVMGKPGESEAVSNLLKEGLHWLESSTVVEALDLLSNAKAVVGVDTGLTHLAVNQQVPTVTLFRNEPIYLRQYKHCDNLVAPPCPIECQDKSLTTANNEIKEFKKWTPKTWACSLNADERCMSKISVDSVYQSLQKVLSNV